MNLSVPRKEKSPGVEIPFSIASSIVQKNATEHVLDPCWDTVKKHLFSLGPDVEVTVMSFLPWYATTEFKDADHQYLHVVTHETKSPKDSDTLLVFCSQVSERSFPWINRLIEEKSPKYCSNFDDMKATHEIAVASRKKEYDFYMESCTSLCKRYQVPHEYVKPLARSSLCFLLVRYHVVSTARGFHSFCSEFNATNYAYCINMIIIIKIPRNTITMSGIRLLENIDGVDAFFVNRSDLGSIKFSDFQNSLEEWRLFRLSEAQRTQTSDENIHLLFYLLKTLE